MLLWYPPQVAIGDTYPVTPGFWQNLWREHLKPRIVYFLQEIYGMFEI